MTPQEAIDIYGSVSRLARAIGVTRQTVHRWVNTGQVPPHYQALITLLATMKPLAEQLEREINGEDATH